MRLLHHLSLRKKLTAITAATSVTALVLATALILGMTLVEGRRTMVQRVTVLADLIAIDTSWPLHFDSPEDAAAALEALAAAGHERRG